MSTPGGAAWFAHRLDSWSKIAREKVKRAADLNESPTNTSSDDGSGSTSTVASMQKENSKETQKSASSSFEVE